MYRFYIWPLGALMLSYCKVPYSRVVKVAHFNGSRYHTPDYFEHQFRL